MLKRQFRLLSTRQRTAQRELRYQSKNGGLEVPRENYNFYLSKFGMKIDRAAPTAGINTKSQTTHW